MQAGASMMDPNHFLMIVMSRFELFHIFSSADVRKRYREANKVSTDSTVVLQTVTDIKKRCSMDLTFYTDTAETLLCVWQDLVQQNNTLIEEMLHLIIMVVGESVCAALP